MNLPSVCSILSGYTARGRLEPATIGGVLAIQLRDLPAAGQVDVSHLTRVQLDDARERHRVYAGDVLFRSRGDRNTAVVVGPVQDTAVAVLPLMVLRPNPDIVAAEYLAWAINLPETQRFFNTVARGTNLRMISREALEKVELDIPDIQTQQKIVAIAALAERERQLSMLLADARRDVTTRVLSELAKQTRPVATRKGMTK